MKIIQRYGVVLVGILVTLAFSVSEVLAIPAFARKYKTSCVTCHDVFPRLNAVGESFRLNGYKFAEDETYIKDEPVALGQEAYKRVWPEAVWPSDISGLPPIAVRLVSAYEIDTGGTGDARSSFVFPDETELIAAGALGNRMSTFVEIEFEGGEAEAAGWVQFEDLLGQENMFNIMVGTVGMQDMGLFTPRGQTRLTENKYLHERWTMPYPDGFSTTNDFEIHEQPGVEINGFGQRWRYAVGVVNGNMSAEDNNSDKDIYTQIAYKFGGLGFDGSGMTGELGSGAEGFWQDDSVILSLFGYRGKALVNATGDEADNRNDDFWRFGPGARLRHRDLSVAGGFILGKNDNPYGTLSNESVDSRAWFLEGEYFVYPWLVPFLRYETLDLDLPSGIAGLQSKQDQSRIVVGAAMLLRANVKLSAEGRFYTKDERSTEATPKGEKSDSNEVVVLLDVAF